MTHQIILDGVDISPYCQESIQVTFGERVARTASFTYYPPVTPALPTALIRKPVTISENGTLIFTGEVLDATWTPKTRQYAVACTDQFQEFFETKTTTEILALIPGSYYSKALFGDREDGWRVAQDVMSTVPSDVFLDEAGALQAVAWAAKTTPDRIFTAGNILNDGAYQMELMPGRDVITQYKIQFKLRMSRWKLRTHKFSWSLYNSKDGRGGADFCEWLRGHTYPTMTYDMVLSAASGTGWEIQHPNGFVISPGAGEFTGIRTRGFPLSGSVCSLGGDPVIWLNTDEAGKINSTYAAWTGTRNWAQTLTETYEITLDCTAAQASFGVVVQEDSAAYSAPSEDSSFENGVPTEAYAWNRDTIGDYFDDQYDETERENDILAMIGVGHTHVWKSLRSNYVTVDVPLDPTLSLDETVLVTTDDIDAQGKLVRVTHSIRNVGARTSQITIAIARGGGGTTDPLLLPARPNSEPGYGAPSDTTSLGTYVGGCSDAPDFREDMLGFVVSEAQEVIALQENPENDPAHPNYDPNNPDKPPIEVTHIRPACTDPTTVPTAAQMYPTQFKVQGPDIEDAARDENAVTSTTTYNVAVPDDTLVLR